MLIFILLIFVDSILYFKINLNYYLFYTFIKIIINTFSTIQKC